MRTQRVKTRAIAAGILLMLMACASPTPPPVPTKAPAAPAPAQSVAPAPTAVAVPAATSAPAPTKAPEATKAPAATQPTTVPAAPKAPEPTIAAAAPVPAPGAAAETAKAVTATPVATFVEKQLAATATADRAPLTTSPAATAVPQIQPTSRPEPPVTLPNLEKRQVELEWVPRMRLGDSEIVRLTLQPTLLGVQAQAELQDGRLITRDIVIPRSPDVDVWAQATLDGVNYDIDTREQRAPLLENTAMTWRWTVRPHSAGQHPLSINVFLQLVPKLAGNPTREYLIFSHGLKVDVASVIGLSTPQAGMLGGAGTLLGGLLGWLAWRTRRPEKRTLADAPALTMVTPNNALQIEQRGGASLPTDDRMLLQGLFRRYARIVIEREFRSGYSGARTYLVLPVREDGRSDAHTIAKLGPRDSIAREHANYEAFVKNTLPPVTARIQEAPVAVPAQTAAFGSQGGAALRYSFIGEMGQAPVSLRAALLGTSELTPTHVAVGARHASLLPPHASEKGLSDKGQLGLLNKLFDTFGPNWWMQRKPYTFQLAAEYDQMLPPHLVMQPADPATNPVRQDWAHLQSGVAKRGDVIAMPAAQRVAPRSQGPGLSLDIAAARGQPAMRVRWLADVFKPGQSGVVIDTRDNLLRSSVSGLALYGLPDPLPHVTQWLDSTVQGTQSTIHGDLNLENVLVGPGGFVWLIDFANTRDGHTLLDFAHLQAEIISHVIAPDLAPDVFVQVLHAQDAGQLPYSLRLAHARLHAARAIAERCLFNPSQPREFDLALALTCVGALKFANLEVRARHLLYLAAAHQVERLAQRA